MSSHRGQYLIALAVVLLTVGLQELLWRHTSKLSDEVLTACLSSFHVVRKLERWPSGHECMTSLFLCQVLVLQAPCLPLTKTTKIKSVVVNASIWTGEKEGRVRIPRHCVKYELHYFGQGCAERSFLTVCSPHY